MCLACANKTNTHTQERQGEGKEGRKEEERKHILLIFTKKNLKENPVLKNHEIK